MKPTLQSRRQHHWLTLALLVVLFSGGLSAAATLAQLPGRAAGSLQELWQALAVAAPLRWASALLAPSSATDNDDDLILNATDLDDDNDGIPDSVEGNTDSDGDGLRDSYDLDSDDDGIPDAVEANNGVLPASMDGAGKYPLLYMLSIAPDNDSDNDGLANPVDTSTGGTARPDLDQDGDGLVNRLDRDADNDGLVDAREANGGSLPSGVNSNGDDENKVNGGGDTDLNDNGLKDTFDPTALLPGTALANPNTDVAGRPDFLDLDADDDGATDWFEAQALVSASPWIRTITDDDDDNDGLLNESDPNEAAANELVPVNTDGSDLADYRDSDSDNDGVSDRIELLDDNRDGAADFTYASTDTDNDGLVDAFDAISSANGVSNLTGNAMTGGVSDYGMKSARPNADFDYLLDWRDPDDDNDGVLTASEDVSNNYLVYTQGGYSTQTTYAAAPTLVAVPDYLHPHPSTSLKADKRQAMCNWNDGTFSDGSPGGTQVAAYSDNKTYKRGGVSISIAQFSTTSTPVTTTIPQPGSQSFGVTFNKNPILETDKFLTYGSNKLQQTMFQTVGVANRTSTAIYKFSQALRDLSFGISDLDFGAGAYVDDIEVVGYRNGTAVTLPGSGVLMNASAHVAGTATVAGGQRIVARSTAGLASVPSKQSAASVSVRFSVPVDELRLYYRNGNNLTAVQIVGISDLRWANTDFDGDNVADGTQSPVDDLDSDNDGIADLVETGNVDVFADADNDGIPNYLDSNSSGWTDTNADGVDDRYDRDLDGQINPLDRDADNDGLSDTREAGGTDANGDGALDGFVDANGDGLNDATAATPLATGNLDGDSRANYLDLDSDNDGITDANEARQGVIVDANRNGVADAYTASNADLNFDGLADAVLSATTAADFDGDGKADYLDRDSDNDGLSDVRESGGTDANNDGVVDSFADANGDGLNGGAGNVGISGLNSDADALANYVDRDSDNDGLVDVLEAGSTDTNGNGMLDGTITDANGDGMTDSPLALVDTDGDSRANYLDLDSDNDGISDLLEGQPTTGRRALANADTDSDGLDNNFDKDVVTTYAISTPNNADDTPAAPDYLDRNADNDQFNDFTEGFDDDKSGYSLNDLLGRVVGFITAGGNALYYLNILDTDFDGIPNYMEDDDGDGIHNLLDFGNVYYRDSNGNGLIDLFDPSSSGTASATPSRLAGEADFRRNDLTTPLPVTLVAFEAKAVRSDAQLSWTTASETNNHHFAVERSLDGTRFESIGRVVGHGTSTQQQRYDFTDVGIGASRAGTLYYRLQQVDTDGKASRSPVRSLTFAAGLAGTVELYPNPSRQETSLNLTALPATDRYQVLVQDLTGRRLSAGTYAGGRSHQLDLRQLPPGVYLVVVQGAAGSIPQRLVVE